MERRLAAIMAADVVGYSRLIRADEEGTIAALKALRADLIDPKLAEHNGRIVKLMGDGMLAEFASVVDAVRAAVETQTAVAERNARLPDDKRIEFRVGVNLGDVVIDGDDIHGDGVNVAARLEGLAEAGGVCISGMVHEGVRDRLDFPFEDLGEQEVKNIDRPVRVWRWIADDGDAPAGLFEVAVSQSLTDKPSIAVLPFENMSGDPEQEYFSDGMADDIITEISRFPDLLVIARNSSFVYKGKSTDIKRIGRELGVRYVLEGSVRRGGDRVRINAQLIDAESGNHLWAERYDRNLEDIFEVQDEITLTIASTLGTKIFEDGMARAIRKKPSDIRAYDLTLQAWALFLRFTRQDNEEARRIAQTAKELAPDFAQAYAILAWTYGIEAVQQWSGDFESLLNTGHELARKAASLDDKAHRVHVVLGFTELFLGRHERALGSLQKALNLNPNDADGRAHLANALTLAGSAENGLAEIETAMKLNPHYRSWYNVVLGRTRFALGNYEEAEQALVDVLTSTPEYPAPRAMLAATLAAMGRLDEAKAEIDKLIKLVPGYSIRSVPKSHPYKNPEVLDRFLDALRKAGLPQ